MVRDDFLSLLQSIILSEIPSATPCALTEICYKLQIKSGGCSIYIPAYDIKYRRNMEILADAKKGIDKSRIASKHNLTVRQINKIISSWS